MSLERRALQAAFALAGLVPVGAGLAGAVGGAAFVSDGRVPADLDSHFHYLSGLLLAIGLSFWACIPRIERRTGVVRIMTLIVVVGGLARAYGLARAGWPGDGMGAALVMELVVTPLLCLWQGRVARQAPADA